MSRGLDQLGSKKDQLGSIEEKSRIQCCSGIGFNCLMLYYSISHLTYRLYGIPVNYYTLLSNDDTVKACDDAL